jgi:Gas vesicle synthesis protein GvpL/GvpF
MPARTRAKQSKSQGTKNQGPKKAVYVYGILPGDIELESGTTGVGEPPAEVRVVTSGDLAALVSDVDLDKPLGRPDDLYAHEDLLDAIAADVPVLPLRFGAVVTSDKAVAEELLGAHHDEFASALDELEGHAEYVVRGRYVEDAILREVLDEDPRAGELRDQLTGADEDATRDLRMQLGELVTNAIEAKRQQDTRALGDAVGDHVAASVMRAPTHDLEAVHAAFLVNLDAADDLEQAVDQLASDWDGRIELRLQGPLAAYDFVGTTTPAQDV